MEWPLVGRAAALEHSFELIESGTGIALLGPSGVGKSRLLHELIDGLGAGWVVVSTVASASTRSVPFSPFIELLPDGPTPDRLTMLGEARAALERRASSRGLLLAVDDAHHLDEMSLAFLGSVVASGIATVALTARSGEPMASELVDLWTNGVIERVDIGPLSRGDAERLAGSRLGDLSDELSGELWELAAGNPLVLHELIEGAVGSSIVQRDDGVWTSNGPMAESARLSDLVHSRLASLPGDLRASMDMLAVGGAIPWPIAVGAFGETLPALEQRRLVSVSGDGDEARLVPAHPLYGEILKPHIGEARTRTALRRLVDAAVEAGSSVDSLQAALWQRDGGELVSPELALAGAQEALIRHEPGLVEGLLEPLGTEDDRVAVLLGRSLSYRQRFQEAEEVLVGCDPSDPALLCEVASTRAHNLAFGLGRVAEARGLLTMAAERVGHPDLRARLMNERALVSAIHGDVHDSELASREVLADPATSPVSRASAYVTLTVALAMVGDCDGIDQVLPDALEVAGQVREVLPLAADQVGVMGMVSASSAGRLDLARAMVEKALDDTERGLTAKTTWMSGAAMIEELSGQLHRARTVGRQALEVYAEADPFGLEAQIRGLIGVVAGQMGESIQEEFFVLDESQGGARITVWVGRGRAWSAAARGDLVSASEHAISGGRGAVKAEHYAWAMLSLLDVVRFGRADLVVDDMAAIDTSRGADLLTSMKCHAIASAAGEPSEVDRAGGEYALFGCLALAADAFAQASALWERQGNEVAAALSAARSLAAEMRCTELATPAIKDRPRLVTSREIEVALDAATGLSSPRISERRFISVRTVDNHLSSVYRKLGLSGREELADAFGEMSNSPGPVE